MSTSHSTTRDRSITVGYQLLSADGGLFSFGAAEFLGTPAALLPGKRWVAVSSLGDAVGLVAATADGAIVRVGAPGSVEYKPDAWPGQPVVDLAVTPDGDGFWLLDAAGGVFSHGSAAYHGSIPALELEGPRPPASSIAPTPTGAGYWILDRAGGIYTFGDADFFGSVPSLRLTTPAAPAVDILVTSGGNGYLVLEMDGTIRSFGNAPDLTAVLRGRSPEVVAMAAGHHDSAVLAVDARGLVYPVGFAPMLGSAAGLALHEEVVDLAVFVRPECSTA